MPPPKLPDETGMDTKSGRGGIGLTDGQLGTILGTCASIVIAFMILMFKYCWKHRRNQAEIGLQRERYDEEYVKKWIGIICCFNLEKKYIPNNKLRK